MKSTQGAGLIGHEALDFLAILSLPKLVQTCLSFLRKLTSMFNEKELHKMINHFCHTIFNVKLNS